MPYTSKYFMKNDTDFVKVLETEGGVYFGGFLDNIAANLEGSQFELAKTILKSAENHIKTPPLARWQMIGSGNSNLGDADSYYKKFSEILKNIGNHKISAQDDSFVFFRNIESVLITAAFYQIKRNYLHLTEDSTGLSNVYFSLFDMLEKLMSRVCAVDQGAPNPQEISLVCNAIRSGINGLIKQYNHLDKDGKRVPYLERIRDHFLKDIETYVNYKFYHQDFNTYINSLDKKLSDTSEHLLTLATYISQATKEDVENDNVKQQSVLPSEYQYVQSQIKAKASIHARDMAQAILKHSVETKEEDQSISGPKSKPQKIMHQINQEYMVLEAQIFKDQDFEQFTTGGYQPELYSKPQNLEHTKTKETDEFELSGSISLNM